MSEGTYLKPHIQTTFFFVSPAPKEGTLWKRLLNEVRAGVQL